MRKLGGRAEAGRVLDASLVKRWNRKGYGKVEVVEFRKTSSHVLSFMLHSLSFTV